MLRPTVKVSVGWGSQTESSVNLNFRIEIDGMEWVECIEHSSLCILSESIESNCQSLRDLYFPAIDDQLLNEMYLSKSPQKKVVSPHYMQNMEVIRKSLEVWILTILQQMSVLDDESKQWCKQLFFKSQDKLLKFDRLNGVVSEVPPKSAVSPPVTPPRAKNDTAAPVPKNDPAHKDYNKSIFTKMSHKIRKIGKPKSFYQTNTSESARTGEEDDDEPRLTITDKESVYSYSQSDRATPRNGNGKQPQQHRTISFFKSNRRKEDSKDSHEDTEDNPVSNLKIEVQRGEEYKPGVIVYDIILKITNKKVKTPIVYSTFQRYNSFKTLNEKLSANNVVIAQTFPVVTTSVAIFGLSDSDLSDRTRKLDVWFREVCTYYRSMPAQAKSAVREFLNFDMTRPKDIFVQDQLSWGIIEPLQAVDAASSSVLVTSRAALSTLEEGVGRDKESESAGTANVEKLLADYSRMRQSLYAASDAGAGTRMSFMFPVRRESAAAAHWETQSSATGRR